MPAPPAHPEPLVHFGGPDKPPRLLRDLLQARIEAVPPGGWIAWATYYFRDRDLARALMAASDRGVEVMLRVEGAPRRRSANAPVLAMLRDHGLGGGLWIAASTIKPLHPHLHSKIYGFSHPHPAVFVGSFNPSGDVPEDPDVIAEIGDQDRGDNLLVELAEPAFVEALRRKVARLGRPLARLRNHGVIEGQDATAWFFPRLDVSIVERALKGAREISGCISHLKPGSLADRLQREARRGARVRLLVHDTERRVPEAMVAQLQAAGIAIRRVRYPDELPMHAKFILADGAAWFGSFNYNPRSRWLNHEILLRSRHPAIVGALVARYEEIAHFGG